MVGKDGAETKRLRYEKIGQTIQALLYQAKQQGLQQIPLNKTVTILKVSMGLSREKLLEMLQDLEVVGQFELDLQADQIRKHSGV
jgi:hypothetical protein